MVAADTAAEVAAEVAAADPSNRHPKKSSQTCIPCRVRKVRCDGRRDVCQNCERLGFTCSFHDAASPNQDSENLTNFTLPRRRVRLACANCHSRKARCSGETPKCARCQAQGIECVYKPTKRSGGASSTAQQAQQGTTDSELESVSSEPPEKRVMTSKDNQGSHHGPQGPDHQNYDSNGISMSTSVNHEPFTFPDETLIQKTFNNFFRHVHHVPIFSFLHRASLMQRYHAGMMDKALLLALVGITSLLMDLGPGTRDYGARCIDECQTMVLQDLENPSTIKIQALVLIMKHRMLSRKFTTAFMLAATATRFAYALRLNYENPNLCFLARESRRRLMWALLTIDSGINGGCSDFTLMPSESMHVQLPCTERNFEFDLPQVTEYLRPVPTRPFPDDVGSLALHVRLLWMRSRVLYCTKNVLGMPEAELAQLPELVKVLSEELTGFNDHLPASFKFSESNLQLRAYSPRLCVYIMIHVWWRQCYCDLYRMFLVGLKDALPQSGLNRLDPHFVSYCASQCYEHALAMADIFKLILSLDGGLPVTDLDLPTCAYQCARIIYFAFQNSQAEVGLTSNQVHEIGTRCLTIAKSMDHVPAGTAIVADLEKLIARGLSTESSHNHAPSPNANASNLIPQAAISRRNQIQQMPVMDESGFANIPIISSSTHISSPQGSSMSTPIPHSTHQPPAPQHNRGSLPGTPISDFTMGKPNLAPVMPPDGIDNNNAFEGAMDGFDFNLESFGSTGLESTSWLSNDWLSNEYSQTTV
ncbi:uncharacterized protein GGS22DRAFT_180732 [Annulohypoxylon maeteangense]|uniref:uncharacterized protein n=1 Tax=Annulohypoxylon maeteangense TaxID=1927788 RepID=UPI0020080CC2|nr:uncharacterized protein GGS22DRAFT_180732 [Annulohypoxylon maeteangense]KAI0883140.1 hypothetical protein GGS22DRAFT_180732 [Annulohypoxylon maeteangense]